MAGEFTLKLGLLTAARGIARNGVSAKGLVQLGKEILLCDLGKWCSEDK